MSNYKAIVCRIKTRPHPNADRIQLAVAMGHQVVIGLDRADGELGVFFPSDGQLSHEMCMANNLYRENPDTGELMGGFFCPKRRVKTQGFRGEKSEGFWCPIGHLEWTGHDLKKLKEGDQFSELNGKKICNKYIPPFQAKSGRVRESLELSKFVKHWDTSKFRYHFNKVPPGAVITITEKLHGTSQRTGQVAIEEEGWKTWFGNWFGIFSPKMTKVFGSRNVNYKGDVVPKNNEYRLKANSQIHPLPGEIFFYEIVGFGDNGGLIMPAHQINDKKMKKKYGDHMTYDYGCNTSDVYVYRIARWCEDQLTELSWTQVEERCAEIGVKTVPVLDRFVYDGDAEALLERVEHLSAQDTQTGGTHISEGVCIRVEHAKMHQTFKYKSFWFCELEGIAKNSDDYVDPEDIA